jgi:glycosyltransferase involved in cell wall biosynthesis
MTMGQPFVTVITPCYNSPKLIGECIESVLKHTYTNFEYLLVKNCSKDNMLQIMHGYARRDHQGIRQPRPPRRGRQF